MKKIKKLTAVLLSVLMVMSVFSVTSFSADSECAEHSAYHDYIDGAWYEMCSNCDYKECACEFNGSDYEYDRRGEYRICDNCGKRTLYCDHSDYDYYEGYYGNFYCEVTDLCDCSRAVVSGTKHQLGEYDKNSRCFVCSLCGADVSLWIIEDENNYITDNGDGTYSGEWASYDIDTGALIGSGELTLDEDGLLSFTGEGVIDFEGTDGGKMWELDRTLYTKECPYCTVNEYEDIFDENGNYVESIIIGEKNGTHGIPFMAKIKNITFGEGITKIDGLDYLGAHGSVYAESIKLPSSIEEIGEMWRVSGISAIEIPENYKTDADSGIFVLAENVTVDEANPYLCMGEDGNIYSKDKTVLYKYLGNEASFTVPDTVSVIAPYAFIGNETLKKVVLTKGVKKLSPDAFAYCAVLEEVVLPEGLESIGEFAFVYCVYLEKMDIPDTVTEIGENAFEGCMSLKEVTLPEGLTEIKRGLFSDCMSLETVNVPSSVKKVAYNAFDNLFNLKEIYIYTDDVDWFEEDEYGRTSNLGMISFVVNEEFLTEVIGLFNDLLKVECGAAEWDKEKYDCFYEWEDCYLNQLETKLIKLEKERTDYDDYIPSESLTIYCNEGSSVIDYAKEKGIKYETGVCEHTYGEWVTDEAKGIKYKVCSKCGKVIEEDMDLDGGGITVGGYDGENKFIVEIIDDPEDTEYIYVRGLVEGNIVDLYDINLLDENGNKVQPEGKVKIRLPLESDVLYFTVLRINGDGTYTDMKAVREGDCVVFETDHFSYYVILGGETQEDTGDSSRCNCICHTHPILEFIFKVLRIIAKFFGGPTELFCDC